MKHNIRIRRCIEREVEREREREREREITEMGDKKTEHLTDKIEKEITVREK